jgi:hypothetical protein
MGTPRRRRWIWLIVVAALLLGGWLVVRALLQPERLSRFLLQQAQQATGLEISLGAAADVGFWPDLHLELEGLSARAPGSENVVLQAERVDAVLPWSALRAESIQLRSLRLQAPVLDTEALSQWLQSRDRDGPPAPLRLARIDAAVDVESGRIQGDGWTIGELDLSLPFLRVGEAVTLVASGRLESAARAPTPFAIDFDVTPKQNGDELRLESLSLDLRTTRDATAWIQVEGLVALPPADALHVDVIATLPEWPADWPALPLPDGDASTEVRIDVDYAGTTSLQGEVLLSLSRGDADLRGTLALGDVFAWLEDPAANLLPPLRGEITSDRMEAGGFDLRGVRIRIEDAPPAAKDHGG